MTARKLDPPPVRRYTLFPCLSPIFIPDLAPEDLHRCEEIVRRSRFIVSLAHTPTPGGGQILHRADQTGIPRRDPQLLGLRRQERPAKPARSATVTTANRTARRAAPCSPCPLHGGVGELSAVVTRYFGGIKLGTGGLVRAYQGMVKLGPETLPTREHMIPARVEVVLDYPHITVFRRLPAGLPGHRRLGKLRRGRHLRTAASRSKHPGPRNRADGTHGRGSAHHTA